MEKKLLFSVTSKDVEWQFFRCGGKGGQNVNKVSSGARCIHKPSGAVGQSCETRDQHRNRKIAWRKMAESKEFQSWAKVNALKLLDGGRLTVKSIDEIVDEAMKEENIKVEYIQ